MKSLVIVFSIFYAFSANAMEFKNASGHLENISPFPAEQLKVVVQYMDCKWSGFYNSGCEANSIRRQVKAAVPNKAGYFRFDKIGLKKELFDGRNHQEWSVQVEFPDGTVSTSTKARSTGGDLILRHLSNLSVFRAPELNLTIVDQNGAVLPGNVLAEKGLSYCGQLDEDFAGTWAMIFGVDGISCQEIKQNPSRIHSNPIVYIENVEQVRSKKSSETIGQNGIYASPRLYDGQITLGTIPMSSTILNRTIKVTGQLEIRL
ncbi:MAG TPA: hypothetical protein VN132_10800 [Bdellovibrio sp.]|nr:hypothetical protein [Bdellovibrio sp.]